MPTRPRSSQEQPLPLARSIRTKEGRLWPRKRKIRKIRPKAAVPAFQPLCTIELDNPTISRDETTSIRQQGYSPSTSTVLNQGVRQTLSRLAAEESEPLFPSFTRLLGEVRNLVYRYILDPVIIRSSGKNTPKTTSQSTLSNLLLVSRQINKDFSHILF